MQKQNAMENKLPNWCELIQQERHLLIGELIDAMIYSGEAVSEVQKLLSSFKARGLVKNIILPDDTDLTDIK